ncbi:MAG: phosphodiester glycosidase family protein [Planctomycetota bacterium]
MSDQGTEAPTRSRARGRRLALGAVLLLSLALLGLQRAGYFALFSAVPFAGPRELGHGVVAEVQDRRAPPASRLVVLRIPRGKGLRLAARLSVPDGQGMLPLRMLGEGASALAAVNGDYHRLWDSWLAGTPYSTVVTSPGRAPVVGALFSYSASFWIDQAGAPHVGKLDLGAEARFASGESLPVCRNVEGAEATWVDRSPSGRWLVPNHRGRRIELAADGRWRLAGEMEDGLQGPALLVRIGSGAEHTLEMVPAGAGVELQLTGADRDRVALAIGSGPQLLRDGELARELDEPADALWEAPAARTAVGIAPSEVLLVTTVQSDAGGISLRALARALRDLGCTEALNLDGGPSSTTWAPGGELNKPAGAKDRDVEVASGLLVLSPAPGKPGLE